ncbi:SGNH/GDSL hydrolase family protein [bacterium]|nr:SGNH/GDSL hydrolase family protein [bacterium]
MIFKDVELYNVYELIEVDGEKNIISRIPDDLRIKLNEGAKLRAIMPAGCEIRFNLKSDTVKLILQAKEEGAVGVCEVYQGNFLKFHHFVSDKPTTIELKKEDLFVNSEKLKKLWKEKNLPFDPSLTRVILPHLLTLKIIDIEGEFTLPEKNQTPAVKYLSYGSSITHGSAALRSSGSYAMRTAQLLGVDLINLGFGGGAHLEKEIADYIAERNDWDFATFEMGINMIGSFGVPEFKKRVEYFIPKIAEKNPDKWIFCVDIFTFNGDFFETINGKEKSFREIVKSTVENLNMEKVVYVSGKEILKNVAGLAVDLVHPSPSGMEEMARNLSEIIKKYMKL